MRQVEDEQYPTALANAIKFTAECIQGPDREDQEGPQVSGTGQCACEGVRDEDVSGWV